MILKKLAFDALAKQKIIEGDVIVIRYEGPKGGPGMREMLAVTARRSRTKLGRKSRNDHGWTIFRGN